MHIPHIATRFVDRSDHHPGDVGIDHPYRRRWWLPVIGPTATVLLDQLSSGPVGEWRVHDTVELGTAENVNLIWPRRAQVSWPRLAVVRRLVLSR